MSEPGRREPDTGAEPARAPGSDWAELAKAVGVIAANVSILTALLVYFGWAKADAESNALGIHESLRGLSLEYYLLSSVGPLLPALVVMAVVGLGFLWLDNRISRRVREHGLGPFGQVVVAFLALTWLVLPLLAWLLRGWYADVAWIVFPLAIGAGVCVSFYAMYLRYGARGGTWRWRIAKGLAVAVVALSIFWAVAQWAQVSGMQVAARLERALETKPMVVVFSPERLSLSVPPENEEQLVDPHSDEAATAKYRYRYTGLHFVEYRGGRYFLLPSGWTAANGVVIVLPDDGRTRLEFVRLAT
jgi:hypothetical protein